MKKRLGRAVSCLLCLTLLLGMIAPAAASAIDLDTGLAENQDTPEILASDEEYEIYPTPHSITYGNSTVTLPDTMQVTYGDGIDEYTKDRAVEAFAEAGVTLIDAADPAAMLDETADPAAAPDETADSEGTPDEAADPAETPDEAADPEGTPDEAADPAAAADEAADPEGTPDESADPAVPDEAAGPAATPDESADPAVPDEAAGPTATPDESADPAVPDESADPAATPDETDDSEETLDEATAPAAADGAARTTVTLRVGIKADGDGVTADTADLFDKTSAYKLTIDASGITVVGVDTDAAFYGLTTVKRILQQVEGKAVRALTVEDYADVPFRGFIEGYYGNPWTVEDRAALMEFGGELKMNIYFYAPKDDPKHSSKWRELYTQEELETKIRPLAEAGNKSKCYYGFALHPFWAEGINYSDDAQYAADLAVLKAKFEQVMEVGVRQIAILADDRGVPGVGVERSYVRLMTDLTEWVSSAEMQEKYPGLKTSIPFCPNDYMGDASSDQMQTLKNLPDSVPIIQTGGAIWGSVSHGYLTTYRTNMGDKGTFMWINWPCSDQSKGSLIMGAHDTVLRDDLTQDDIDTLKGIMLNPMQQSEPSKAAIFQNADYAWNVWNGSDSAQRIQDVWDDCFKYVDHDSAIETPQSNALRELSKHMIHNNGSGWRGDWHESAELKDDLSAFRAKLDAGTLTQADITAMRTEFETLNTAATLYRDKDTGNTRILGQREADGSYPNNQEQMAPWLDCWVELTQANLDLLDALELMISNSAGANDSRIVEKYLAGQSKLEASRSHKFWYVDHYEYAIAGGEYIAPFTNDLMAKVSETAKTIIDPGALIETIITNRTDTPVGGLAAMRDGDTATEAVFQTPNSIEEGTYVGVRYNRAIPITSVRFELGTAQNANNTFTNSKLQYMDASGSWQDIPGAVFTGNAANHTIEVSGLNLNAKGVRVIATSSVTNIWLGIKEIYINGQSGGGSEEETPGGYAYTATLSDLMETGDSGHELSKMSDGKLDTSVWLKNSTGADNCPQDAYIQLDLGSPKPIGSISLTGEAGSTDVMNVQVQYLDAANQWQRITVDGVVNHDGDFSLDVADQGITAQTLVVVIAEAREKWWRIAEIAVAGPSTAANDADKIAYQSGTVGRITNPVGQLTEDSASLSADAVLLKPGEFVGIALPRIRAVTDIVADYTAAPGVVLEVGMNEAEMEVVDLSARAAYSGSARYIRLRNTSSRPVSFKLNELSVRSEEAGGISYLESNIPTDGDYYISQDARALGTMENWFDGSLSTSAAYAYEHRKGDYVLFDLGQRREIRKIDAVVQDSAENYLRTGEIQVSLDKTTWTTVVNIDMADAAKEDGKGGFSATPLDAGWTALYAGNPNTAYQTGSLDTPVAARYLRVLITESYTASRFPALGEIVINDGEYVPAVNDPTYVADPIEQGADYTPDKMRDGDLTTAFRPNMTGRTSGSIIYRLSDNTSIGQINVVEGTASGAEVSVRPVGGSDFQELGTLNGGLNQVTVPEAITGVAEIKLSWGDTTPSIYELITVARDKVEEGGGQVSSGDETVPINSYSGSDCSILFDENWKFNLGDASGAQAEVFNDSAWRTVNLPHDFSIEQDYTASGEAESGYLPGGTGWYRKSFTVDPSWADKTVTIDFGGAYMDTEVYLNGTKLGEHHYGYTPFSFVLTGLKTEGENVIAVKVANPVPSSRWYSGSGIYRSVYLTVSEPVHVAKYGAYVTTTNAGAVTVKTDVQNDGSGAANVTVQQEIFELDGTTFEAGAKVADNTSSAVSVSANGTQTVTQSLSVSSPKLWNSWDKGTPNLYVLKTTVLVDGVETDTYETEFGFREIDWDVNTGFKLNGENLKLKGVCQHHDQGALGAEAWYRALERQVEILMDMGCNSIRVTHNPAADELIEICNRKGVLVIDELFDGWAHAKNGNSGDFARWFNRTLGAGNNLVGGTSDMKWQQFVAESVVNRDKNAPCVIMYSLCNEVQEGGSIDGNYPTYAGELISWIQAIDSTRYITRGDNSRTASNTGEQGLINKAIHEAGGAVGFNYGGISGPVESGHNMGWRMYASETASHVNSRGVYNIKGSQVLNSDKLLTAYDKSCVGWGQTASNAWWSTIRFDYNAGEYVWTGFDYIGEPTPNNGTGSGWVNGENSPKNSYFGAIDTNGLPKDNYYLYRSMWNDKSHTLHILPTWDRDDLMIENGKVEVVVYTDAPMVKLYLNDVEVGSATATTHTTEAGHVYRTFDTGTGAFVSKSGHETLYATFNVSYEEGTLKAVACDESGTPLNWVTEGRSQVRTTSGASRLAVSADRAAIKNDGRDLSYITIDVVDASGEIVNGATPEITVSVEGDGVFMGLDNGVQPDHTSYLSNTRKAGAGRLVAIVQSTKTAGSFTVTATSNGLTAGSATVTTSGAASTVDPDAPVSYDLAKTIYVQRGVMPDLPASATVTLGSGTTVTRDVTWDTGWDRDLLNTVGSEFAITGIIAGYNIPVSVGIVVVDQVVALLNYSTAVRVGQPPILPDARPAVMADGAVLNAQFPVTWDEPAASAYNKVGTVEVSGTAEVFGQTLDVTAWVRVSTGGVAEGSSVSNAAVRPTVNGVSDDELLKAYDGNAATVWTGSGETAIAFDTAQNLYRIKLTYQGAAPATGVTLTLDGGVVTVNPKIEGSTATYELGGINSSVNVKLTFDSTVSLAEVDLIVATPTFDIYSTAELDGLKFNGQHASAAEMASRIIKTPLLMPAIVPESSRNVACTILPEDADGRVIIVTESENHSARDKYTVYLGAPETLTPSDDSRDYPYDKTTATAPSQQTPASGNEGPIGFANDNNEATYWHSNWNEDLTSDAAKRYIQLELEEAAELTALRYKPRPTVANGIVTEYRVEVSMDGVNFTPVATGTWAHDTTWKIAMFDQETTAKYVRLYGVTTKGGSGDTPNKFMSCAELRVVVADDSADKEDLSMAAVEVYPTEFHWTNVRIRPERVTVSLFGKTLTEGTDYTLEYENNRDPGTAYVYVIAKEGSNYKGSTYATFTIIKTDATIVSFEPRAIWVQEGVVPELPETIWASMSDGHHQAQDVVWDTVDPSKYMNPTETKFEVEGTVKGTALKPVLTVHMALAQSADSVSAMTAVNTKPALPHTVNVQFDDGASRRCAVTWDVDSKDWNQPNNTLVEVTGTISGISRITARASVRVAAATPNDTTNIALNTNSASNIFPFALAYWSAGNNNPYQAIKGTTTGSTEQGDRWSDWERNTYHTDPKAWMGVAFETSTSGLSRQQNQVLTLVPHLVNKVKVMFVDESGNGSGSVTYPESYKIQYYTGPMRELTFDTRLSDGNDGKGNGQVRSWAASSPLKDDANWSDVTVTGTYPAVPSTNGQMLEISFEPVQTTIIRVLCTPQSNKWTGIQALEVYGLDLPAAHSDFEVTSITLDSEEKLSAFDADKVLEVELGADDPIPQLAVTVAPGKNASVSITQASRVPGLAQAGISWATASITSEDDSRTDTYTVKFTRAGMEGKKYTITPKGDHADKIILSASSASVGEVITIGVAEGYELTAPWVMIVSCDHADNDHRGQRIDVVDGKFTMREGNVELSATVTTIRYPISYELNGGEETISNFDSYTVESPTFTLRNPVKAGYTFVGWTGTGLTEPTLTVTIPIGSTGNRSYTANWEKNTSDSYAITYDLNGGTLAEANPDSYTSETPTFTLNNPTRSGYTFVGWTGTGLTEPALTVTIEKGSSGARSYTANYTQDSYTIAYNLNDGTLTEPNPGSYTVESPTFTLRNPEKEGYTFVGWTGTGLTEPTLTVTIPIGSTGHRSYVANWQENTSPEPENPIPSRPVTPPTTITTVEKNEDGSITTTVTDKKTGAVTVTTENPDGGKVVKATDPEKNVAITVTGKDGEVLVKVELPAELPVPEEKFTDVPEGHWAEEAINQAAGLGLVNGVGNGEFNQNGNMKRGDLALILSRMSNVDAGSYELTFSDVPSNKYYANGVAWAAKVGVVTGHSEDVFKPEDTITREELAVMLYRYAKLLRLDSEASADELDAFTDGSSTHSWAEDGVAWCVKNGILKGKGGSVLDPRTNVTRAEVAVMLQRFMDLLR